MAVLLPGPGTGADSLVQDWEHWDTCPEAISCSEKKPSCPHKVLLWTENGFKLPSLRQISLRSRAASFCRETQIPLEIIPLPRMAQRTTGPWSTVRKSYIFVSPGAHNPGEPPAREKQCSEWGKYPRGITAWEQGQRWGLQARSTAASRHGFCSTSSSCKPLCGIRMGTALHKAKLPWERVPVPPGGKGMGLHRLWEARHFLLCPTAHLSLVRCKTSALRPLG